MSANRVAYRALAKARLALAQSSSSQSGSGGSGGSSIPEEDRGGESSPEGAIEGSELYQQYVQTDAGGTVVVNIWYFTGVVGNNTGWITFA